jgi:lysophospholipase L1-like esterase
MSHRRLAPRWRRFEPLEDRLALSAQGALVADATAANAAFVNGVYRDTLGRSADAMALNVVTQQLNDGQPQYSVPLATVSSDEFRANLVAAAYQEYLGRKVDPAALDFWVGQMRSGMRDEQLVAILVASDEFYTHAGGNDGAWTQAAYQSLLGRPAEAGAVAWVTGQLASGASRGLLAVQLAGSLEHETQVVRDDYSHFLRTTPDAGGQSYWATRLAEQQLTNEQVITTFAGTDDYYQLQTGVPPTVVPAPIAATFWTDRNAQLNARAAQGNAGLLFVGDSITQFWENAGQAVWAQNYAPLNAVNEGISGDRTQNVLWRLDHGNLNAIAPSVAVVMMGINNLSLGDSPQDTAAGVSAIVATLRQRLPETKVLVLGILPAVGASPTFFLRQEITTTNQILQGLADGQNVFYLDMSAAFTNPDGTIRSELYQPFLVHPNEAGYAVWAQTMAPQLQSLLAPPGPPAAPPPAAPPPAAPSPAAPPPAIPFSQPFGIRLF